MEAGSQAWVLEEQLTSRPLAVEPSSQPHHTSSSDLSYMVALFLVSVDTSVLSPLVSRSASVGKDMGGPGAESEDCCSRRLQ